MQFKPCATALAHTPSSLRLVDIGVPRNIASDVREVSGVESHDVDDLQEVVERNQEARQQVAREAEGLAGRTTVGNA